MFGVDALERKYGPTPPMEWRSMVDGLNDAQLSTGIASVAASGSSHMPTLPEFMKRCREAREFAKPLNVQRLEDDRFDAWDIAGNNHLMAYLRERQDPKRYVGQERTMCVVRAKNHWTQIMRESIEGSGVDVEVQRAIWADQMARAETEIDAIAARAA